MVIFGFQIALFCLSFSSSLAATQNTKENVLSVCACVCFETCTTMKLKYSESYKAKF